MRCSYALIVALAALCVHQTTASTTYYVSNTGSDNNAGTSRDAPWQTINGVNAHQSSLRDGDSVQFCQGQTFDASTLRATTSGVMYSSYQCGLSTDQPILTASKRLTNQWHASGSLLSLDLSGDSDAATRGIAALWVNGKRMMLGRFPNLLSNDVTYGVSQDEFIMPTSVSGNTLFASNITQPAGFFNGAAVTVRVANYHYQSTSVSSSSTGSIQLADSPQSGHASGFFLQHAGNLNVQFFVDAPGEYALDSSRTLYVYPLDDSVRSDMLGGSAECRVLYGKVMDQGNAVQVTGSNVILANLQLSQSVTGVSTTSGSGLTVRDCSILSHIEYGVYQPNAASSIKITGNTIRDIQLDCVKSNMPGGLVERNTISKCGLYVVGGIQYGNGVSTQGGTVQYNQISDVGYAAVLPAYGAYTYGNTIANVLLTLNDGAAVYTSGAQANNLVIYQNTISNVVGNFVSWTPHAIASCVFVDQGATGVSVANNICSTSPQCITLFEVTNAVVLSNQCNAPGLYIRSGSGNAVMGNVVLSSGTDSIKQNAIVRVLGTVPQYGNGYFAAYYNSYCSSVGGATYLFQRQTTEGTNRYNNLEDWRNAEVALGNSHFEILSTYTTVCADARPYFGEISPVVAHTTVTPPTAGELRAFVNKKIAELPPVSRSSGQVNVAAIIVPVVAGSILIIAAVIAVAVHMVRREKKASAVRSSLAEPLNSFALRPIVYHTSPSPVSISASMSPV